MSRNLTKNHSSLICLALTLVTLAVYYQVHNFKFINFDDPLYVSENPNIQSGFTVKSIEWALTTDYGSNWYPITWFSHILDWQLFGANVSCHHLVNLIFHIVNALLLFIVLKQMTSALWQSVFVAALFALHPLHVESVAWVAERKDVLSTFFWILSMWAYLRYVKQPNVLRYLLTLLIFCLGLMAKPMLVTLPFVFLLLDYWPLERISRFQRQLIYHLVLEKIPFIVVSAVSIVITLLVQQSGRSIISLTAIPLKFRVYNVFVSYVKYICKMFWPSKLTVFYPYPRLVIPMYAIISVVFLLAVTVLVFRFAKNHRYLVTGWFWYLGTLVPVIGIVQVGGQAMADRYSYITLTGLFIIIAWGFPELLGKRRHRKIVIWTCSLAVLSVLTVLTYIQTGYWKDSITIYRHSLDVTKNNYSIEFGIAEALADEGRIEEAIRHYTESIRIQPDNVMALNNLGILLYKTEKIDGAISCYKRAMAIDPCYINTYANLAIALAEEGKYDEAISLYKKALQIAPDFVDIRFYFGFVLANAGKLDESREEFEKILLIQPENADAHADLAAVLLRQGKIDDAIAHLKQAVQINPNDINFKNNLNLALENQKHQNPHD